MELLRIAKEYQKRAEYILTRTDEKTLNNKKVIDHIKKLLVISETLFNLSQGKIIKEA